MKKKKQALTLIEIMIVIVLIGLIGSVIGVNMKGSLEEGKAFKTRQAQEQITDILMLEVARGEHTIEQIVAKPQDFLEASGLVKNGAKFCKDGWGTPFNISIDGRTNDTILVKSENLAKFDDKKKLKRGKVTNEEQEEN